MANLNDGRVSVDVSTSKTLVAADSGIVQNIIADGVVITLPATAAALEYTIRNGGAPITGSTPGTGFDGSVGFNITPNAADGITGFGFTAAVSKGAVSAKSTSLVGDEIRLAASGTTGATGWAVQSAKGVWARQA